MKRGNLKILVMLLATLMMLSVLTSCAQTTPDASAAADTPKAADESAPPENVTITFWHTYGDGEEPTVNDVVLPAFSAKYPNIKVESVRQTGDLNQMIVTSFATGQVPDIARIDLVNTAAYAAQGGIIALDDMPGFDQLKDACLSGPLSTNFYKGKYYGLPLDTNCKVAVCNMKTLETIGLTEPPKTMEEFISAVEANGGGKYFLDVSSLGDWDMYPYFWLFGGTLTDADFTKASGYLDSPESISAMEKIVEIHDKEVLSIKPVDGTPDAWDGIPSGEYGMFFEGPWYFGANPDAINNQIVPALIPTYNGKTTSVVGGEDIVIFSGSQHPEEAYEFMKFMLSEDTQYTMLDTGQLPVLKSAVTSSKVTSDPIWSIYLKQLETAQARIPSPQNTTIGQIWTDALTSIFTGGVAVDKALGDAAKLIDAELAK